MSLTRFAEGFTDGVRTGVDLGGSMITGQSARGIRNATAILAEMEGMSPTGGAKAAVPDGQGNAPSTGYDGNEWDAVKRRYLAALADVSDPRAIDMMMEQAANLEKNKVMEYGRLALAALRQGNTSAAQRYAAGISYYTMPGVVPNVQVSDDGVIMAAGEGMNPIAMQADDLEDFLHQFVNYEGYRDLAFDREQHADMMAFREQQQLDLNLDRLARLELDERRVDIMGQEAESRMAMAEASLNNQVERNKWLNKQTALQIEQAEKNFEAAATKAQQDRLDAQLKDAQTFFDSYLKDAGAVDATDADATDIELGVESAIPAGSADAERAARNRAGAELLDVGTKTQVADQRNRQASMRLLLSDPQIMSDIYALIRGMAAADPTMTGQELGAMALNIVASAHPGGNEEPFYDAERGEIVTVNHATGTKSYRRVHPAYQDMMGTILDPWEGGAMAGPEDSGGIPDSEGP